MNFKSEKLLNIFSKILFITYLFLFVWIVLFKCNIYLSITNGYWEFKTLTIKERFLYYIVPFEDYLKDLSRLWSVKVKDGVLNIFIFMPIGLYLSYFIKEKKFIKTILYSIIISLSIEIIQLFTLLGSFQSEDLILNLFGGFLGYFIYRLLYKKHNSEKRIISLNVVSLFFMIVLIPIAISAFIKTIDMIDLYIDIITKTL